MSPKIQEGFAMVAPTLKRTDTTVVGGTTWKIDPLYSSIDFSVKHMKIATVHGHFDDFRGTFRFDPDRPSRTKVEVEIDAASINTGIRKRDNHLRSPDFFDVVAYPSITFVSTEVTPISSFSRHNWLMTGALSVHGITRSVELSVKQIGDIRDGAADSIEFAATGTIKRKWFGMEFNLPIDVVADEIRVSISIHANRIDS
jgi:polyisoprenoid-binding protein YceI